MGIESKFMAENGRDWLRQGYVSMLAIVVGSRNLNGLKMFDPRMIWQILASVFVIRGSVGGAFILSCRLHDFKIMTTLIIGPRVYANGRTRLQIRGVLDLFHCRFFTAHH